MNLAFHLKAVGVLLILLGLAHGAFGSRLNWKTELERLSPVNRQIFLVHCFYIALFLVMLGSLSLFLTPHLLEPSPLSRCILGGGCVVWSLRLYIQWFVFDRSLWRDSRVNRRIHYLLTVLWVYFAAVNGIALVRASR